MNPHFSGESFVSVGLQGLVRREKDTALDGAFYCWADPENEEPDSGTYPFVFDVPDCAIYSKFELPSIAKAHVAAFDHEITFHESPEAFYASQYGEKAKFGSQSFIPSGLFTPDGGTTEPLASIAIFTGHVLKGEDRRNSITGMPFSWALVYTYGGKFDVVVDHSLLTEPHSPGGVIVKGSPSACSTYCGSCLWPSSSFSGRSAQAWQARSLRALPALPYGSCVNAVYGTVEILSLPTMGVLSSRLPVQATPPTLQPLLNRS